MNETEADYLRLYDEEADALYRFLVLRAGDHDRALDILSESFLRLLAAMKEGKVREPRAYLYRTARNLIIDDARTRARENAESLDRFLEEGGEIADGSTPPVSEFDLDRLRKLLAELEPPEYREAIIFRYGLEWTPKEIARELEVSENVVSVRINRGIKKLRATFDP